MMRCEDDAISASLFTRDSIPVLPYTPKGVEHITIESSEETAQRLADAKGSVTEEAAKIDAYVARQKSILSEIEGERLRQNIKFTKNLYGDQYHSFFVWNAVLAEEAGEVSKAVLEQRFGKVSIDEIRTELIQVAAVAVAIVERIDAGDTSLVLAE